MLRGRSPHLPSREPVRFPETVSHDAAGSRTEVHSVRSGEGAHVCAALRKIAADEQFHLVVPHQKIPHNAIRLLSLRKIRESARPHLKCFRHGSSRRSQGEESDEMSERSIQTVRIPETATPSPEEMPTQTGDFLTLRPHAAYAE